MGLMDLHLIYTKGNLGCNVGLGKVIKLKQLDTSCNVGLGKVESDLDCDGKLGRK